MSVAGVGLHYAGSLSLAMLDVPCTYLPYAQCKVITPNNFVCFEPKNILSSWSCLNGSKISQTQLIC